MPPRLPAPGFSSSSTHLSSPPLHSLLAEQCFRFCLVPKSSSSSSSSSLLLLFCCSSWMVIPTVSRSICGGMDPEREEGVRRCVPRSYRPSSSLSFPRRRGLRECVVYGAFPFPSLHTHEQQHTHTHTHTTHTRPGEKKLRQRSVDLVFVCRSFAEFSFLPCAAESNTLVKSYKNRRTRDGTTAEKNTLVFGTCRTKAVRTVDGNYGLIQSGCRP